MDNVTTETAAGQQPADEPQERPAPAGGKSGRKPPSPEQAKLAAERKRLKRQMEKLLADGDADAIAAAAARLAGAGGGAAPADQTEPAALAKVEPAEKPAAPAPTAEETAAMVPVAQSLVAMVAAPLAGTRFDPMEKRPNPLDPDGPPIIPAAELTKALAPVLAKYLPAVVTTPEGQLMMVAAMWLGPPTAAVVMEKLSGGDSGAAGAEGAGVKAG